MARQRLSEAETRRRKNERQAQRMNDRELKAVGGPGSLFAAEARTYSPAEAGAHRQRVYALAREHLHTTAAGPGSRALAWVQVNQIEHHAAQVMPAEDFRAAREKVRETFGASVLYYYGHWRDVLTGEEIVCGWKREPAAGAKPGFRVVPSRVVRLDPAPMTREEFHAAFPYAEPKHFGQGEPADADEQFAAIMDRLAAGCRLSTVAESDAPAE